MSGLLTGDGQSAPHLAGQRPAEESVIAQGIATGGGGLLMAAGVVLQHQLETKV